MFIKHLPSFQAPVAPSSITQLVYRGFLWIVVRDGAMSLQTIHRNLLKELFYIHNLHDIGLLCSTSMLKVQGVASCKRKVRLVNKIMYPSIDGTCGLTHLFFFHELTRMEPSKDP